MESRLRARDYAFAGFGVMVGKPLQLFALILVLFVLTVAAKFIAISAREAGIPPDVGNFLLGRWQEFETDAGWERASRVRDYLLTSVPIAVLASVIPKIWTTRLTFGLPLGRGFGLAIGPHELKCLFAITARAVLVLLLAWLPVMVAVILDANGWLTVPSEGHQNYNAYSAIAGFCWLVAALFALFVYALTAPWIAAVVVSRSAAGSFRAGVERGWLLFRAHLIVASLVVFAGVGFTIARSTMPHDMLMFRLNGASRLSDLASLPSLLVLVTDCTTIVFYNLMWTAPGAAYWRDVKSVYQQ